MAQYDRWTLKTAPQLNFGEIKFGALPSNEDNSPSLLKQSAQEERERNRTLSINKSAIDDTFAEMSKNLHHDAETDNWIAFKKKDIERQIQGYTSVGDYEGALNKAKELASKLKDDPEYQGRLKANSEFKAAYDAIHARTDLDEEDKEYWDDMNQFQTKYNYSADGKEVLGVQAWKPNMNLVGTPKFNDFMAATLKNIQPNSTETGSSSSTKTGSSGSGITSLDAVDKNGVLNGSKGYAKTTTSSSTTRSSSVSTKTVELTSQRLKDAINIAFATNPEIARGFEQKFNEAVHFADKYSKLAVQYRAAGNETLAREAQSKADRYSSMLTNTDGTKIHSAQAYVTAWILTKAPEVYKYRNYSHTTATAYEHITGNDVTLGENPGSTTARALTDPYTNAAGETVRLYEVGGQQVEVRVNSSSN